MSVFPLWPGSGRGDCKKWAGPGNAPQAPVGREDWLDDQGEMPRGIKFPSLTNPHLEMAECSIKRGIICTWVSKIKYALNFKLEIL